MRFPELKIKEAILSPDLDIRRRATRYFASGHSSDPDIMPLVIKAVEEFGREEAYHLIGLAVDLPQSESTIAWIIDELNDESCGKHESYAYNLSRVLVAAEPSLLLPRESDILEARHFFADFRVPFTERLAMLLWDEATCWRSLEKFCEENKDKQYVNDVNLEYGKQIIEALARYGHECEPRIREVLAIKVDDYSHHPLKWLEPLGVRLAGQARLESTVPLLIGKLQEDADLVNEECAEALTRIGTPAVLQAIAEAFPAADFAFRIYASGPLDDIHSDLTVEICLQLLEHEKDHGIRRELVHALLSQFDSAGIEAGRRLLLGRKLDFEDKGLRNYLLETCTITGERFPEYEQWSATEKADAAEHRRRVKELEGDPAGLMLFALEKLTGKKAETMTKKPPVFNEPRRILAQQPAAKQKVGRNDPCPCGSGKKFKNCCLHKPKSPR